MSVHDPAPTLALPASGGGNKERQDGAADRNVLSTALLVLPDFALMLLGLLLAQRLGFDRDFWTGTEKLVYYFLFPPLLFNAIVHAEFSIGGEIRVLGSALGAFGAAAVIGFLAYPLLRPPGDVFASCVQTAFRYNGLAFSQTLFGTRGLALMALIVAFVVPIANVLAVTALARQKRVSVIQQLVRNPLIIATMLGLACNQLGVEVPVPLGHFLTRLGNASLAIGLICIGAGLTLAAIHEHRGLMAYFVVVKLLVFPACALVLTHVLGLEGVPAQVVLLFSALPTASSSYVLAARMGGKAAPVAVIVTVQTCLSIVTLPLWVAAAAR
jgi:malonate transporter and related proteins